MEERRVLRRRPTIPLVVAALVVAACTSTPEASSTSVFEFPTPAALAEVPLADRQFQMLFRPSAPNEGRESSLVALHPATGLTAWEVELPFSDVAYLFPATGGVVSACACQTWGGSVFAGVDSEGVARWMTRIEDWWVREAVADGDTMVVVLVGEGEALAALDAIDGSVRWISDTDVSTSGDVPRLVANDGVIVVVEGESVVRALQVSDGSELWRRETGEPVGPPFLDGDRVLVPIGGGLFAVDPQSGDTTELVSSPETETDPGINAVMIRSGELVGVRAATARNPQRRLFGVFDLATGSKAWTRRTKANLSRQVWGSDAVVSGPSIGGPAKVLEARDLANGERLWRIQTEQRQSVSAETTAVSGETVYAVVADELRAIDPSGAAMWAVPAPPGPEQPAVIGSILVTPGSSGGCEPGATGEISARNPLNGELAWRASTRLPPRYAPPRGYVPLHHEDLLIFFTGHCEEGLA